jgi:hypothetical protein
MVIRCLVSRAGTWIRARAAHWVHQRARGGWPRGRDGGGVPVISRRIIVSVMAAVAVAAVLAGVSQFGRAPGTGAARAGERTPLPVHSSPGMQWPVTTAPMPPACTITSMRAAVIATSARRAGSVIVLRLGAASRPARCRLAAGPRCGWTSPAARLPWPRPVPAVRL